MAFPPGFLDELRSRIVARRAGRPAGQADAARARAFAGCARSITRRRRPSTSSRTRGFSIASAAARMATRSAFMMRADNLDFIEAVERLAGEAGIAVPQQTPQERERAQRQKTLLEALAAAAAFYEAQLWAAGRGARARISDPARSRRGDDPALPAGLGARGPAGTAPRARGANFPEPLLARGRAACACRTMAASPTIISAAA